MKRQKEVFYMIWDTEKQCFDSLDPYFEFDDALAVCEERNHSIQSIEYVDEGNIEYVDNLPDVFEVRRVTAEKIK